MSAPITDAARLLLEAELAAARAKAEFIERALTGQAPSPVLSLPPPRKTGGKRRGQVKPPREDELAPSPVRSMISAQVDEMALRKGAVRNHE